ncbi:hypothetical protein HDA40_000760 [Hamadaea flava]|uniref:Uncharacterized protein n=1 Tax=Hamadaea flava TaxID=1742688 RepID=A0ABV8LRN4_9ACTN|nr:hypothetical protein [Hamadaea flava]MCP2322253.1 hypothetical protein [Hamadaea flava]
MVPLAVIEPDGAPSVQFSFVAPGDADVWIVHVSWPADDQLQAITRCGRRLTWHLPGSIDELIDSSGLATTPVPQIAKQRFALR